MVIPLLLLGSSAQLDLRTGSTKGLFSVAGTGLTDKQIGLLNFVHNSSHSSQHFANAAEAAAHNTAFGWGYPWLEEGVYREGGLNGLRYQLAFMAYATAMLGAAHTPAFPSQTGTILRNIFARLVHPKSWFYWHSQGVCAEPWTLPCKLAKLAPCQISIGLATGLDGLSRQQLAEYWERHRCPDPVYHENVMFSAHLAQVGALYEAVSGDASLSEIGWQFKAASPLAHAGAMAGSTAADVATTDSANIASSLVDKLSVARRTDLRTPINTPINYTLPTLFEAMNRQMVASDTGAFACEPRVVYTVCNQHPYAASKLFDSLRAGSGAHAAHIGASGDSVSSDSASGDNASGDNASGGSASRSSAVPPARYSSEASKFLHFLRTRARQNGESLPFDCKTCGAITRTLLKEIANATLDRSFFRAIYIKDVEGRAARRHPDEAVFTPLGSPGLDGWVLSYLTSWAADTPEAAELIADARASLAASKLWEVGTETAAADKMAVTDKTTTADKKAAADGAGAPSPGRFLHDKAVIGMFGLTPSLSTSFVPAALGGWSGGHHATVKAAYEWFEARMGTAYDSDGDGVPESYLYDSDTQGRVRGQRMSVTANLALGTSLNDGLARRVYDGSLFAEAHRQPHVLSLSVGQPRLVARRATFDQPSGTLHLHLTNAAADSLKGVAVQWRAPKGYEPTSAHIGVAQRDAARRQVPHQCAPRRADGAELCTLHVDSVEPSPFDTIIEIRHANCTDDE